MKVHAIQLSNDLFTALDNGSLTFLPVYDATVATDWKVGDAVAVVGLDPKSGAILKILTYQMSAGDYQLSDPATIYTLPIRTQGLVFGIADTKSLTA